MRTNAAQLLVLLCGVAVAGAQQDCFGTLADINSACCTPSSCAPGGSGIPDECGADCAALFVPFFQDCRSVLDAVGTVDLSDFDDFYQGCDAVDGEGACEWASEVMAELEDARRQVVSLQRQAGTLRSTSCCEANPHWNGRFVDSAVCGFSPQQGDEDNDGHPDCIAAKNQLEAEEVCMSFGGRLCSVAELISGEASATGCGFDQVQVWSKNAGSCGQGFAMSADGMGNAQCNTVDATLAVRCCADYCGPSLPPATDGDTSPGGAPPRLPNPAGGVPYGVDPAARAGTAPAGAKNVLMVVVDDLRDEIAGLFGKDYMHTPNIDALAAKSLGLTNTHVQQALCGPSRASFLTGRRPETTRIYDLHTYWRDAGGDFVTIPQHFAENGYATRGFGKIMHPVCGSAAHDSPGECDPLSWTLPYFHSPNEARWTCSSGMVGHGCDAEMPSHYAVSKAEEQAHPLPDTQNCDAAMQQLVDFAAARDDPSQPPPPPFFLAMGFHKPHLPFVVPERHVAKYPIESVRVAPNTYPPTDMPRVAWSSYAELRSWGDIADLDLAHTEPYSHGYNQQSNSPNPGAAFPDQMARELRQHYYASVTYTDEQVGRLLGQLADSGYAEDTIVLFFGDHGWQLGEHGEWAKHTDFDIATRVPMLLYVPGVTDSPRMSRVTNAFAELVDVMPTLSDFAGIPVPELCPVNPNCLGVGCSSAAVNVRLCTEGQSLRPVVDACASGPGAQCDTAGKRASFSVYPHYGYNTPYRQVNGYTMTTRLNGVEYRYTEWVPFDVDGSMQWWTPDYNPGRWEEVTEWCADPHDPRRCNAARELYNHDTDPAENSNLAEQPSSLGVVQALAGQLHAGWRRALMDTTGH